MRYIAVDASEVTSERENRYPSVARWLIEVDELGSPIREIGLSSGDAPVYRAPNAIDRGLFTDSPVTFGLDWTNAVDLPQFEKAWALAAQGRVGLA